MRRMVAWVVESLISMPPKKFHQRSQLVKRSVYLDDRKTSAAIEDAFWDGLKEIALAKNIALHALISAIDRERDQDNLSSAIRLFVLDHYRSLRSGFA
jgi:predicted DNA-binding ribbon-helix-helix protein